jgi:hypothetical protein
VAPLRLEQGSQRQQPFLIEASQHLPTDEPPLACYAQVLQEIATVESGRLPQLPDGSIGRLGLLASPLGEAALERFYVVGVGERTPEDVAAPLEGNPLLTPQGTPQPVEGVVDAASKLGSGGPWPEGQAYLLLGSSLGVR